jgi:hypothetical protein
MGIKQVLSAPRSPWQRAYIEPVIGTIRRECLDHMIVFNERCLLRQLKSFTDYYHRSRTHLALEKDSPEPRPIQPPDAGRIIAIPEVGGLHHRYDGAPPKQTPPSGPCRSVLISRLVVCSISVPASVDPRLAACVFMPVRRSGSRKYRS